MSQEDVRKRNRQLVIEAALALGIEKGVDAISIRQIAQAAGLTERSIYRYFENRGELVLSATYLFWDRLSQWIDRRAAQNTRQGMTGLEQVEILMRLYSRLYIEHPEYIRFILSAEIVLHSAGIPAGIRFRPPGRFEDSNSPMVRALHQGRADGSIGKDVDIKELYYNSFDAILGTMQRQLLEATDCDLDIDQRMDHLCGLFIAALQGRI